MTNAEQLFASVAFAFSEIEDAKLDALTDRFLASIKMIIETQSSELKENDVISTIIALQSGALAIASYRINELEEDVAVLKAMIGMPKPVGSVQ